MKVTIFVVLACIFATSQGRKTILGNSRRVLLEGEPGDRLNEEELSLIVNKSTIAKPERYQISDEVKVSGEARPQYASEIDEYNRDENDFLPQGEITELDSQGDPVVKPRKVTRKKQSAP